MSPRIRTALMALRRAAAPFANDQACACVSHEKRDQNHPPGECPVVERLQNAIKEAEEAIQ